MRVMKVRNVNEALVEGLGLLASRGQREASRAGDVVSLQEPLTTVTLQPTERVLFSPTRDANPFFHLFESLWMLSGRQDSASLNCYVKDFGDRFADKGDVIHDAYGHRWRHALGFDQLNVIVDRLRSNPQDRQCVLQMWDGMPEFEEGSHEFPGSRDRSLYHGSDDLCGDWKTRPCNTHCYFRVRGDRGMVDHGNGDVRDYDDRVLDMTVCCRSNDAVWGAHGANTVHFSVLLEYLAGQIGVRVGRMYQVSNNYHGYVDILDKMGEPSMHDGHDYYADGSVYPMAMGTDWSAWDNDLRKFMAWHDWLWSQDSEFTDISVSVHNTMTNSWFHKVAVPMTQSQWLRKHGRKEEALEKAGLVAATDWRTAAVEWLQRREK